MLTLPTLPSLVVDKIWKYLDNQDLLHCAVICKALTGYSEHRLYDDIRNIPRFLAKLNPSEAKFEVEDLIRITQLVSKCR